MTKVTIHSMGTGLCALTNKEADGVTVTFDDQTVSQQFLSWKALKQLLALKVPREPGKPVLALPVESESA